MLDTNQRQGVTYFTGEEVEHTICHGMRTLFVVGTPPVEDVLAKALQEDCKHIYFGTSQSFNPTEDEDYEAWEDCIIPLLKEDFWVTLDFDVKYAEGVLESGFDEYDRFVAMISVKLPYIKQFNYNATIKLDDRTWGDTNSGVWSMSLHELMKNEAYTHWDQYTNDTNVDRDD